VAGSKKACTLGFMDVLRKGGVDMFTILTNTLFVNII
jgi:hypothetical protein